MRAWTSNFLSLSLDFSSMRWGDKPYVAGLLEHGRHSFAQQLFTEHLLSPGLTSAHSSGQNSPKPTWGDGQQAASPHTESASLVTRTEKPRKGGGEQRASVLAGRAPCRDLWEHWEPRAGLGEECSRRETGNRRSGKETHARRANGAKCAGRLAGSRCSANASSLFQVPQKEPHPTRVSFPEKDHRPLQGKTRRSAEAAGNAPRLPGSQPARGQALGGQEGQDDPGRGSVPGEPRRAWGWCRDLRWPGGSALAGPRAVRAKPGRKSARRLLQVWGPHLLGMAPESSCGPHTRQSPSHSWHLRPYVAQEFQVCPLLKLVQAPVPQEHRDLLHWSQHECPPHPCPHPARPARSAQCQRRGPADAPGGRLY